MKNHPFTPFVLNTNQTIPEILALLEKHVDEKRVLNNIRSNKKFEGVLFSDGFDIRRIPSGTNSFIPNLIGRFEKNNDGIDVIVRIRPNKIIITILASVFLLLPIIDLFIGEFTITSLIIPLFILVIAPLGFNSERKRAKRLLEKALKI